MSTAVKIVRQATRVVLLRPVLSGTPGADGSPAPRGLSVDYTYRTSEGGAGTVIDPGNSGDGQLHLSDVLPDGSTANPFISRLGGIGCLVAFAWATGYRVYAVTAGLQNADTDLTDFTAYTTYPVTLVASSGTLPASGTTVSLSVTPTQPPARQFYGTITSPVGTTELIGAGALGSFDFRSFRAGAASGSYTLTVNVNGSPVAGWTNLAVGTTPATSTPDSSPVGVGLGQTLSLTVTGSGGALYFGFSE